MNQLQNADPSKYPYLLGSCIYEYTPDYQNPIGSNNYTFSLFDDDGTTTSALFTIPPSAPVGGGAIYPVQCLKTSKPVYSAVRSLWNLNTALLALAVLSEGNAVLRGREYADQ